MSFKEIPVNTLNMNPFSKIGNEWALLTAGTKEDGFNTMTASWAGFGRFWEKNVITVYIRESRYTRQFFEKNMLFSVSFYNESYRKALALCGKLHGNECDKVKESGLTPLFADGTTAFEEANLIFICKKMLHADVEKCNTYDTDTFAMVYPENDLHRIYLGEVIKVLTKE